MLANPGHAVIIEPSDRRSLHADIRLRFENMLRAGLVEEVMALRRRWPMSPDLPCMRAVGYRQVSEYLDRRSSHEQMIERSIAVVK